MRVTAEMLRRIFRDAKTGRNQRIGIGRSEFKRIRVIFRDAQSGLSRSPGNFRNSLTHEHTVYDECYSNKQWSDPDNPKAAEDLRGGWGYIPTQNDALH